MVADDLGFSAIVLAGGGDDKRLHSLSAVKALLPVANRPLLSYPLRRLAESGVKHAYVVVSGDKPSAAISSWIQTEWAASSAGGVMQCEVVTVPEEYGSADALRAVSSRIQSNTVVVVSGDLIADIPINALVASHQMHGALATITLGQRKVSPASETKPGKPPRSVDYIGLDVSREHLLFCASSPEALKELRMPLSVIGKHGTISISTDLVDAHLYVFSRSLLVLLGNQSKLTSLRQDLLPFLAQQQFKPQFRQSASAVSLTMAGGATTGAGAAAASSGAEGGKSSSSGMNPSPMKRHASSALFGDLGGDQGVAELPGADFMELSHSKTGRYGGSHRPKGSAPAAAGCSLRVHVVQQGTSYCARVTDAQSYGEVNREVADPNLALHLSGLRPTKYDNIIAASTTLGNKTTVAAACIVGENCVLGDKSSIKRSVLGNNVMLGISSKVINSVIHDNVTIGEGCTIQNSVLCSASSLKDRAAVKDSQVGPGYTVAAGVECKGEVLARQVPSASSASK